MTGKRIAQVTSGIVALGGLLLGIAAVMPHGANGGADHGSASIGRDNTGGCVAVGGSSCQIVTPLPAPTGKTDQQIADDIVRPTVTSRTPAPFMVLFDHDPSGLFIRSSPNKDGFHIGLAPHESIVWVDCVTTTDYNADPATPDGPKWYRVHWPSTQRSEAAMSSSAGDRAQGWAFAYYLRPNGSNGKVPAC